MVLSKGDLAVNEAAMYNNSSNTMQTAKLSKEQIQANEDLLFRTGKTEEEQKQIASNIKEIIVADRSGVTGKDDYKYTFDTIYQDEVLAEVAKKYYGEREGKVYSNKEAIDKFISDRTWKQANTASIGKELFYITGDDVSQDQKARLAYLTKTWGELPNFYEEGGRGFEGFYKNLGIALTDPLNLISGGVGGIVGKAVVGTAAKQALKTATKSAASKKVLQEAAKDILIDPQNLAEVSSKIARNKLLATAGTISVIDGVGFGLADIASQTTEKELGLREKLDPYRTMLVSLGAAGTSFVATGGIGYGVQKFRNVRADKAIQDGPSGVGKIVEDNAQLTDEGLKKFNTAGSTLRANLADQYDFVKVLQKNLLGVEGSPAGLKSAIESGKYAVDPVLMPYFQLRMAAAASTRAHEFIAHGVHMPPSAVMGKASFEKGRSLGLQKILEPLDDMGEVPTFLAYIAAKRQKSLVNNNPLLKNELPSTPKEIEKMIDYGEMTSAQYQNKYKEVLKRKMDYQDGATKLKVFTDELLEYQVKSGLLSAEDASKILKANEFFIPLYRSVDKGLLNKAGAKVKSLIATRGNLSQQTENLIRPSRPGAKKLAKEKLEGDVNLYDNLVTYVYKAINGADRNRAKIALYEMINKAKKLKKLDRDAVVKKTDYVIKNERVIGASIKKKYEDAGFKVIGDSEGKLPNLDVAVFGSTFKKIGADNFIDIVYVDGKQIAYEILSPELHEAFVSFGDDTVNALSKALEKLGISWYARAASKAITYSPPFVAFNAIRDTLAGTVNSVFGLVNKNGLGFIPGFTSVKGFINSFRLNDKYRKAMISGMGYSSRSDSEAILNLSSKELAKFGSKAEQNLYKGSLKKLNKMLGGGWRGWKEFVSRVEYSTRMGEYELAKRAGFSDVAAGFFGREVSTDFGMRGSSKFLRGLSNNTMFLNAGLQGLYRTGRLAFEGTIKDRARVAATIGATIVAPEIYLYFKNRDIPEYKQLDERIKQLNYVIPTYENVGGNDVFDGFIYIPKPYDLGVFANLGVALIKGVEENTPELGMRYMLQSMGNVIPSVPIPTAVNPALELLFNRNFYTGSTVLGIYEKQTIDSLQYRPQTREIAKKLANFLSNMKGVFKINQKPGAEKDYLLSPIHLDYLIGAYATGIMQYPFDIINDVFFEAGDKGSKFKNIDPFKFKKKGLDIIKAKADKSSRKFNILEPWTIVTNRFESNVTIKNSFYHKEWFRIQKRAKELGILDINNLNNAKKINESLIKVFDNLVTNIDNNEPLQSKEVEEYTSMGDTYKQILNNVNDLRAKRKLIEVAPGMGSEEKRIAMNQILAGENLMLQQYFEAVAGMDLDFLLSDTLGGAFGSFIELKTQNKRGN